MAYQVIGADNETGALPPKVNSYIQTNLSPVMTYIEDPQDPGTLMAIPADQVLRLTRQQYDALTTRDPRTVYIIES